MSNPLKVIADTLDRPLVIGAIKIPCYVLEDGTRVLSQGGLTAIGRAPTSGRPASQQLVNLPAFLAANNLNPFIYFSGVNQLAHANSVSRLPWGPR